MNLTGMSYLGPKWVSMARIGKCTKLLKSDFSIFSLSKSKCTEIDLKSPTLWPIYGHSDRLCLGPNLTSLELEVLMSLTEVFNLDLSI